MRLFIPKAALLSADNLIYSTLAANIRRRRGSKVAMNMPIFFDEKTPRPFIDHSIPWDRDLFPGDKEAKEGAALQDHIYMDAMGFGMGCSCLQITFQASNVDEARRVYDTLIPVGPIMVINDVKSMSRTRLIRLPACPDSSCACLPRIFSGCRLSLECHRWQCRRSHARRTRSEGPSSHATLLEVPLTTLCSL